MEKYFEPYPDNLLRWDLVKELEELMQDKDKNVGDEHLIENHSSQFLQRSYFSLYGKLPIIEKRTFSICSQCEQVFNPKSITVHKKNCTKKGVKPLQNSISKKKVKSKKKLTQTNRNISPIPLVSNETRSATITTTTTTTTATIISNNNNTNTITAISTSSNITKLSETNTPIIKMTTTTTETINNSNIIIPITVEEIKDRTDLNDSIDQQRNYFSLHTIENTKNDSKRSSNICNHCEQVFDSKSIHIHKKTCNKKSHNTKSTAQNLLPSSSSSKKSLSKNKKKILLRNVPSSSLFNEVRPTPSSTITRLSETPTILVPVSENNSTLIPIQLDEIKDINIKLDLSQNNLDNGQNELINDNNNRSNKKLKKSTKEYDPDIHCGVIEGIKGPCTRSITCSNHKLNLRKLVPGRSKDINQLIAERKQSLKDKEQNDIKSINENKNFIILPIETDKLIIKDEDLSLLENFTTFITDNPIVTLDIDNSIDDVSEIESIQIQENLDDDDSPIVYKPMSPISVVSPVQSVKKENIYSEIPQPIATSPIVHNGSLFLCIPDPVANLKVYKSHPKPAILPTYGTRKVGGSIVLSKQRLDWQKNDIEKAILLSSSNDNNKQTIRLSQDINGYILHADMSEAAEAPQHNHTIQENIDLLNMK